MSLSTDYSKTQYNKSLEKNYQICGKDSGEVCPNTEFLKSNKEDTVLHFWIYGKYRFKTTRIFYFWTFLQFYEYKNKN